MSEDGNIVISVVANPTSVFFQNSIDRVKTFRVASLSWNNTFTPPSLICVECDSAMTEGLQITSTGVQIGSKMVATFPINPVLSDGATRKNFRVVGDSIQTLKFRFSYNGSPITISSSHGFSMVLEFEYFKQ